jgi:hypothetical protein
MHIGKTPERLGASLEIGGDLAVARIGFGAMRLCGPSVWGWPRDPEAARMVLRRAIELGKLLPPEPHSTSLTRREIEALADYILASYKGK